MTNQSDATNNKPELTSNGAEGLERLADRIANNDAVLYAGAGVSVSSGHPTWGELLAVLRGEASEEINKQADTAKDYYKALVEKSKSLEAADWLHMFLGNRLQELLSNLFGQSSTNRKQPSIIHRHLARMPFSLAITTNYDDLLDDAFRSAGRSVSPWTWQDSGDILSELKVGNFGVLHAHGIFGKQSSLVITGRQYADHMHIHKRFGDLLKWLLMTKTFLFVGAGLEDPDLIFQLQQGFAEHGSAFGPHYAILPCDQAPEPRRRIFFDNLRVILIPVGCEAADPKDLRGDVLTEAVAGVLRELSGHVSVNRHKLKHSNLPTSDDPGFFLRAALQTLLNEAIAQTGSTRGDICLSPDGISSHLSGKLSYEIRSRINGKDRLTSAPVRPNSICGVAYYQSLVGRGVYLKNTTTLEIDHRSNLGHYGEIVYVRADDDIESEVALPIEADGVRVGVINLESTIPDAYSDGHQHVARLFAKKAGRLYAATFERQRRSARLNAEVTIDAYDQLRDICVRLWSIARRNRTHFGELGILIYSADYETGILKAQDPYLTIFKERAAGEENTKRSIPTIPFFGSALSDKAFVSKIFADGRPRFHLKVNEAISRGQVADDYSEMLELRGPLIGFPVLIHGHIAGVVVAWHLRGEPAELDGRDIELFRRAAHLIANMPRTSKPTRHPRVQKSKQSGGDHPVAMAGIAKVHQVLACLSRPSPPRAPNHPHLNTVGHSFREAVGGPIKGFLQVLHEQEREFPVDMVTPDSWISPSRCRCWVRAEDSSEGEPRFLLALQISLAANEPDSNRFSKTSQSKKLYGIATEPLKRAVNTASVGDHAGTFNRQDIISAGPIEDTVLVRGFGALEALVFRNNPHLSFLLSRISAYRFSSQQRPNVVGKDVMATILRKDANAPWFVAPIIVPAPEEWREDMTGSSAPNVSERMAGYLTFDSGQPQAGKKMSARSETPELTEIWASFQNDLLHSIELFSHSLAQQDCFKRLLSSAE